MLGILIVILGVILGVILAATKPEEHKFRDAIRKEWGLAGPLVELGKFFGVVEIKYNDYLFFSTLTVQPREGQEEPLALGIAGQVFFKQDKVHRLSEQIKKK